MNRDGHKDVAYFIGPEVEKTPAADKRTLFVVGKQDVVQIERMAREYRTPHIFMGANHSFEGISDAYWNMTITALLDKGFWVTLDYQAHLHEIVLKMLNPGIWQSRLFVPLLSVRIPHLQTSNNNLTIKFDDIDFKATNEGVWCLNHHEVTDSNRFTPWQDYTTDEIVAPLSGPVPNPVLKISAPGDKMEELRVPEPVYADINKPEINLKALKVQMQDALSAADDSLTAIQNDAVTERRIFSAEVEDNVTPEMLQGVVSLVQNDASIGLDIDSPSKLKPEPDAVETVKALNIIDAASAADAYAEGAKEDPLGPKGVVKPAKVKK